MCCEQFMAAKEATKSLQNEFGKEAFLETFFHGVGQFMLDAAKELAEKEKENTKASGSIWSFFLNLLIDLVNAEKLYFTLTYIEKRVLRRDVIRPLYDRLQTDLKKLGNTECIGKPDNNEDPLLLDLSLQISKFIAARKEMIDFYAKMAKSRWENKENQLQLVNLIEAVYERHNKEFHHPILDSLKTSFCLEVEIVKDLFKAEFEMQQWRMFPSLLLLFECQARLSSWTQQQPPHSTRQLAVQTTSSKHPVVVIATKRNRQSPFLYQWLFQLHLAAVSKFSLYFHTTLSAQTNPVDMKLMTSKTSTDLFAKICTFIRKSDAFNVSLILDTTSMEHTYCGHGYTLPNIERDKPSGIETYPAIVSLLDSKPNWPDVISILTDKNAELATPGRIIYFFDDKQNRTYYLIKVDVRVYMVIVFNAKKKERDSYVQKFLLETRALLCYDRNYQMLKPSQKFR